MNDTTASDCTCPSGNGSLRHPCPAHPLFPAISHEQAIKLARAAAYSHCNQHSYLPQTWVVAANWQPHDWVISAIMVAADAAAPVVPIGSDAFDYLVDEVAAEHGDMLDDGGPSGWSFTCEALAAFAKHLMSDYKGALMADAYAVARAEAKRDSTPAAPGIDPALQIVVTKLRRFAECAEDTGSEGCDIGRDWFDALTTIGLLERTQRSPALWTMTKAGEGLIDASPKGGSDVCESIASVIAELESPHVQNNKFRMGCLGADNIDTAVRLLTALQADSPKGGSDVPDMFWNDADPERAFDSIIELVSQEWSNGSVVAGDVMEIQQAIRLPNIKVRIVEPEDDGVDYEQLQATSHGAGVTGD